jgi:hypothetical protein
MYVCTCCTFQECHQSDTGKWRCTLQPFLYLPACSGKYRGLALTSTRPKAVYVGRCRCRLLLLGQCSQCSHCISWIFNALVMSKMVCMSGRERFEWWRRMLAIIYIGPFYYLCLRKTQNVDCIQRSIRTPKFR